jgi:hypothetical protein
MEQLQTSAAEHERTQRKLDAAYVQVCYSTVSKAGKRADACQTVPGLALMYLQVS